MEELLAPECIIDEVQIEDEEHEEDEKDDKKDPKLIFYSELQDLSTKLGMNSHTSLMRHILNTGDLSDTTFVIGTEKEEIKAHRYVIKHQSQFFETLFSDRWNAREKTAEITIPDFDPGDFKSFLEFLYIGVTEIRIDNVLPLIYLGRLYNIPKIVNVAIQFLDKEMNNEIAILIFKSMFQLEDCDAKSLLSKALCHISRNAVNAFERPEIIDMTQAEFKKILEQNFEHPDEVKVYKICIKWAMENCEKQGLPHSSENHRLVLGDIVKLIRFPLIPISEFYSQVYLTGILTKEECDLLSIYYKTPIDLRRNLSEALGKYFQIRPRHGTCFFVNRFAVVKSSDNSWSYVSYKGYKYDVPLGNHRADRISFKVDTDISIKGIGLYGGSSHAGSKQHSSSSHSYKILVSIYHHESFVAGHTLMTLVEEGKTGPGVHNENGNIFKITFKKPVLAMAGIWYTISVTIMGGLSYYGEDGKETKIVDCQGFPVTFNFKEALDRKPDEFLAQKSSSNSTGVKKGQIPLIYFTVEDEDDIKVVDP